MNKSIILLTFVLLMQTISYASSIDNPVTEGEAAAPAQMTFENFTKTAIYTQFINKREFAHLFLGYFTRTLDDILEPKDKERVYVPDPDTLPAYVLKNYSINITDVDTLRKGPGFQSMKQLKKGQGQEFISRSLGRICAHRYSKKERLGQIDLCSFDLEVIYIVTGVDKQ